MSPVDVATAEVTISLPKSTLIRILAVLEDAEQVYSDLVEAGASAPWNVGEAVTLSAMYAELDALRVDPATRLARLSDHCDECLADVPCHAHPWPGLAADRPVTSRTATS